MPPFPPLPPLVVTLFCTLTVIGPVWALDVLKLADPERAAALAALVVVLVVVSPLGLLDGGLLSGRPTWVGDCHCPCRCFRWQRPPRRNRRQDRDQQILHAGTVRTEIPSLVSLEKLKKGLTRNLLDTSFQMYIISQVMGCYRRHRTARSASKLVKVNTGRCLDLVGPLVGHDAHS